MARVTAQQYAEKWGRNLKNAGTDIRNGIDRVTTAPGQAAAQQADKMLAGVQRAISDGTWQRAVGAVSLEDWKEATIQKGIPRIAAGVDGAMGKQVQMAERLLANVDAVSSQVNNMPDTTLEDRINRMVAFTRGMSERRLR